MRAESPGNINPALAAAIEAEAFDAMSDAYVTGAYRKHLARILTYRALERAVERARANQETKGRG